MSYNNLRFFDSNGDELNMLYDSDLDLYQGVVYLPLVSTGLYETLTLHLLEEVTSKLGATSYVKPIASASGDIQFKFRFKNEYNTSQDIFLYSAKQEGSDIVVNKELEQTKSLLDVSEALILPNGDKQITKKIASEPITAQIALNSDTERFHIRPLSVIEVVDGVETKEIAEIKIYGETEGEDERLKVLLNNIGMQFEDSDFFIFKDADVNEAAPDQLLLNQKRKELLLQASEIEPFIGTYKALLNAIDFFGYDKITLKEYWLNINEQSENFGKLKAVAVPNQDTIGFLADKNGGTDLPNSNQKKTSRFSLVYRLNTATGELDEWDIPRVEETLDYSPDEVLIKLYGLKNKLQRNYLPLQAKIVDITGEGDYFSQFNINTWNNQHSIKDQNAGIEFVPEKVPATRSVFMEDLRKVDYRLTGFGQDFDAIPHADKLEICDSIDTFYNEYYNESKDTFNTIDGIPIGAPIAFHVNEGLEDTWDFAEFTWNDATDTGNHLLNWENWWHRGVYEIEWHLIGPRGYDKSFRGPVYEWNHFPLTLPYVGKYTVEAHLHDLYNVRSTKIHREWIEVKNKNVEVYGLTQIAPEEMNWQQYEHKWERAGSSWDWSRENLIPVSDVTSTFYLTMDRANYINEEDVKGPAFSTIRRFLDESTPTGFNETPGPYQWYDLETQVWDDGPEVTWKMTRVGPDINSSFKFILDDLQVSQNSSITISQKNATGVQVITETYNIQADNPDNQLDYTGYENIVNELNNINPVDYPIISKFNFNAIAVDDVSGSGAGPQGEDTVINILAVGKEPSRSHDFESVSINNGDLLQESLINFISYNPGFDDTYIINSIVDLHMLNHVTLSYDLTNMPGIISQRWRVINNTLNIDDIYYSNPILTYLFKHKGYHTVELILKDSNGNINKTTKNILNII